MLYSPIVHPSSKLKVGASKLFLFIDTVSSEWKAIKQIITIKDEWKMDVSHEEAKKLATTLKEVITINNEGRIDMTIHGIGFIGCDREYTGVPKSSRSSQSHVQTHHNNETNDTTGRSDLSVPPKITNESWSACFGKSKWGLFTRIEPPEWYHRPRRRSWLQLQMPKHTVKEAQ